MSRQAHERESSPAVSGGGKAVLCVECKGINFQPSQFSSLAGRPCSVRKNVASEKMISGATNTVRLQVASLPDFIIMKAHALGGRDKPKDVYDLCYCLDEYPDAITVVAADWRSRREDPLVAASIEILKKKFEGVDHYVPQQLAIFHDSTDDAERAMHARRAFELVQKLLSLM